MTTPNPTTTSTLSTVPHHHNEPPSDLERYHRQLSWSAEYEVGIANAIAHVQFANSPAKYLRVFYKTHDFVCIVRQMLEISPVPPASSPDGASTSVGGASGGEPTRPEKRMGIARMLIEFLVAILDAEHVDFRLFLPSQRSSVYEMLDRALVDVLVDEWEPGETTSSSLLLRQETRTTSWLVLIAPIWEALDSAMERHAVGRRADNSLDEMFFKKTRSFLGDSVKAYGVGLLVHVCSKRLPAELCDMVIAEALKSGDMRTGRLRQKHMRQEKEKAVA